MSNWISIIFVIAVLGLGSCHGAHHSTSKRTSGSCAEKFEAIDMHSACLPKSSKLDPSGTLGVTEVTKIEILATHNLLRGSVDPPAANMAKMSWDNDLQTVAQGWAENCNFAHETQRSRRMVLGRFWLVGQNLARLLPTWNDTMYGWYNEYLDFTYGVEKYTNDAEFNTYLHAVGHYTQMVWATSSKIGCGFAKCDLKGNGFEPFYVCNYAPGGNFKEQLPTPYKRSTSNNSCDDCPGSKCVNKLCDCGSKTCENNGVMDLSSCTCTCQNYQLFHEGDSCGLKCSAEQSHYASVCTSNKAHCTLSYDLRLLCPITCKVCKAVDTPYLKKRVDVTRKDPVKRLISIIKKKLHL